MFARHRALQPRGRSVLKLSPPSDTVRYPLTTLFPDLDVFPQDSVGPGVYVTVDSPTVDQVNAATVAYLGGHIYYVDDTEAASLIAAGYTVTPDAADTAPPTVKIIEPSPYTNVTDTLAVTVSAPEAATLSGRIGRGSGSLPFNFLPGTFTHTISLEGFGSGVYRLEVTATDLAGNSATAFVDVNVNPFVPDPIGVPVLPSPTLLPSTELLP